MNSCLSGARATVLSLALSAAFAVMAQSASDTTTTAPAPDFSSTRIAGPLDAQPFGTSVITAEQIERSGATSVNDAIIRLLGVGAHLDFFGGGEYQLDLRGFGKTADSNQVVVIDGIRVKESDFDSVRLAGIPIDSVARIEIIRGGEGVLYGAGSTGGVIVITTKAREGRNRKNSGSVYASVGTQGLSEARLNATVASGGLSLDVNALRRNTNNFRDNNWAGNGALNITGQWKNDWLRIGATRTQDGLNTGLPGFLTPAAYAANPNLATTRTDSVSIDNVRQSLFAEMTAGDWQLFADVGRRDKKLRNVLQGKFGGGYDVKATDYALRATNRARGTSLANTFTIGADATRWQRDTPVPGALNLIATQAAHALYLRDELAFASTGTVLSAGVRAERVTGHNDNATFGSKDISDPLNSWELGIHQPLGQALSVYGRAGRSFRVASVEEFNYTPLGVVLKPQRSKDVELGTRYVAGPWKLDGRIYRSALTDEIGYDLAKFTSVAAFGANVNFDPTLRTGIELEGSYAWAAGLDLRANAAVRRSRFVAGVYAGKELVRAPTRLLAVHADWRPAAHHLLSGGVAAVSAQRLDVANLCAMPGYASADARYAYQYRDAEFSLAVTNLFNHRFFTKAECDAPVAGTPSLGGVTSSIFPEPGRALRLAVRVRF
ncbi:MAG: TonB-dependent receptor [Polaromonas sp.]|nr:TonB-dependent receptor [Polaromonas sp.]